MKKSCNCTASGATAPKKGRLAEIDLEMHEIQLQIMRAELRDRKAKARQAEIRAEQSEIALTDLRKRSQKGA